MWGDCSGVCPGQRAGKGCQAPSGESSCALGNLDFILWLKVWWGQGQRGGEQEGEKGLPQNEPETFPVPFKLSHHVPFKRVEGQLLQNVNVSWGELSKFPSFYSLPLRVTLPGSGWDPRGRHTLGMPFRPVTSVACECWADTQIEDT